MDYLRFIIILDERGLQLGKRGSEGSHFTEPVGRNA